MTLSCCGRQQSAGLAAVMLLESVKLKCYYRFCLCLEQLALFSLVGFKRTEKKWSNSGRLLGARAAKLSFLLRLGIDRLPPNSLAKAPKTHFDLLSSCPLSLHHSDSWIVWTLAMPERSLSSRLTYSLA